MITITARNFWEAENAFAKRRYKQNVKRIRNDVESQLRKQLASVKSGTQPRRDIKAVVNVNAMFFPRDYEKALNKRGFVVLHHGEYDSSKNIQCFYVILKGFESSFPDCHQLMSM